MIVMSDIPFFIAIEGVNLAHGGSVAFIGPSETPVLQMDLFQLTSTYGRPESIHTTSINVVVVLVTSDDMHGER